MVDWTKFQEWFILKGGVEGAPLEDVTLKEDLRVLRRVEAKGVSLDELTVEAAEAFLVSEKKRGLGPGGLNGYSKALRRFLRFSSGRDYKLPTWREPEPVEKALSADQKFAALGYMHEDQTIQVRNRFVTLFALLSGVEPGEAAPMDLADFDVERGGVHVRHPVKGHKAGFIPLPASVLTNPRRPSFQTWLKRRPVPKDDPNAVFVSVTRGRVRRMTPEALSAVLQDVRRQTGVPINWQVTRHTWATDLLEAGYSVRYLQKLGRWHNLTHLSRYAEARSGPVESSYRKLRGIDPYGGN